MEKDIYRSQFRLPQALYLLLKAAAERNKRNLNAELIFRLESALADEKIEQYLKDKGMTRQEFDASAKMVERAWPTGLPEDGSKSETTSLADLEKEIQALSQPQQESVLNLIHCFKM